MRNLETYHHEFLEAGTHTFELPNNPKYEILVKNLTSDKLLVSYGTEIDTENDSYVEMLKNTAETIPYKSTNNIGKNVAVTVSATGTGTVELRILDD